MTLPSELVYGVDISVWQGPIDGAKLASTSSFVFVRAAYGAGRDGRFVANWAATRQPGLLRGAYLYYLPMQDPGGQARAMIEALSGDYGDLPLVVDIEEVKQSKFPWTDEHISNVRWCLDVVEKFSDKTPIIYTGTWFWKPWIGSTSWAFRYPLWVASYPKTFNPDIPPALPDEWKTTGYTFWQYSCTGNGSDFGASSDHIDLDVFRGSADKLRALAGVK